MKKILICVVTLFLVACSSKEHGKLLKSPCVDNGGPCQHIPVNNWWLPESKQIKYNV